MHCEITINEFEKVLNIGEDIYRDPLLWAVIEGNRPGRIFLDDRDYPKSAFVWTNTECSYLHGKSRKPGFYSSIFAMIGEEFVPQMEANGETFLSIFTFDQVIRQRVLAAFESKHPLSLGLATYRLDQLKPRAVPSERPETPSGFILSQINRKVLENSENQSLAGHIAYYWGSNEVFLENGLGICMLQDGQAISWCFSEAFGANDHSVNIATRREFRRSGFARRTGSAFIELCLEAGNGITWMCDESNRPAKVLAESLGLHYKGSLFPVDIPFTPKKFYMQVADHVSGEFENPEQAEALYLIAAELK
jgi:hypothetical protein